VPNVQMMNNYLSVGFADAEIALDFHNRREDNPNLFSSRGVNKLWYAAYGAKNALKSIVTHVPEMHTVFDLFVDGNK
jgi:diacylglycerol kinase (ATP)